MRWWNPIPYDRKKCLSFSKIEGSVPFQSYCSLLLPPPYTGIEGLQRRPSSVECENRMPSCSISDGLVSFEFRCGHIRPGTCYVALIKIHLRVPTSRSQKRSHLRIRSRFSCSLSSFVFHFKPRTALLRSHPFNAKKDTAIKAEPNSEPIPLPLLVRV